LRCLLQASLSALGAPAGGASSGRGSLTTYIYFSCLRTILGFWCQSKKFVSDKFSFSKIDCKMLLDVIYNFKIYKVSIMKLTYLLWPLIKYAPTILIKSIDL
jgi:hypothetical protein